MSFSIAEADTFGNIISSTAAVLSIAPTYTVYPDRFDNVVRTSKDGSIIVQTPTKDSRTRKWVWRNYKTTVPKYNALFQQLLNYHYKLRITATPPKSPWIFVQDTDTLNFGALSWNGTAWIETPQFFRAKVVQITQNLAQQAGYPTYGETVMEFYIDDPNWNNF